MKHINLAYTILLIPFLLSCSPKNAPQPARLVQERLEAQHHASELSPYTLSLDDNVQIIGGTRLRSTEGFIFRGDYEGASIVVDFGQIASDFSRVEIEMRVSAGQRCNLAWSSDLEPTLTDNWTESLHASKKPLLITDQNFHTYSIALSASDGWAGNIEKICLIPSETFSVCTVKSITFYRDPPDYPDILANDHEHIETLFGTQDPWTVRIPQNGVFETYYGLHERAWNATFKGVARFQVSIHSGKTQEIILDKKLMSDIVEEHRNWQKFQSDLSKYAGKTVTIRLSVDNLDLPIGDYAFWGNPMVYSNATYPKDIPVILISCDTLRADHVGAYGYERDTTPRLDAWAREDAVLFENAVSPVTWTLPAHITMLTGLQEKHHRTSVNSVLSPKIQSLPDILRNEGYLAAGLTGLYEWLAPHRGYRGFDYYNIPTPKEGVRHIYETTNELESWLDGRQNSRFFLFFHNYDIHGRTEKADSNLPYTSGDKEFNVFSKSYYEPDMFSPAKVGGASASGILSALNVGAINLSDAQYNAMVALYDDCIRMVDENIYEFFRLLKQKGFYDNALIIVVADHGEEFNDHGSFGHAKVYEELCHVPLFIKFPDEAFAGTRYVSQVEITDIFATILDVLDLPQRENRDSVSLLKVLQGKEGTREEIFVRRESQYAVRTNTEKLIWEKDDGSYELYDLEADKAEQNNLIPSEQNDNIEDLKASIHQYFNTNTEGWQIQLRPFKTNPRYRMLLSSDSSFFGNWQNTIGEMNFFEYNPGQAPIVLHEKLNVEFVKILSSDSSAKINLEIDCGEDFIVMLGDETPMQSNQHNLILDPASGLSTKPELKDEAFFSQCAIWYIQPSTQGDTVPAGFLDEETRQQLENLGYL